MKKVWTILLTAFLVVGMTACKEKTPSDTKKDSQKTESGIPEIELPEVWFD